MVRVTCSMCYYFKRMKDSFHGYDLDCSVRSGTLCPRKVQEIIDATGDPSGDTKINDVGAERRRKLLYFKLDNLATIAEMLGQHGDIEVDCPVRPGMSGFVIRQGVAELVRDGIQRVTGRQKP